MWPDACRACRSERARRADQRGDRSDGIGFHRQLDAVSPALAGIDPDRMPGRDRAKRPRGLARRASSACATTHEGSGDAAWIGGIGEWAGGAACEARTEVASPVMSQSTRTSGGAEYVTRLSSLRQPSLHESFFSLFSRVQSRAFSCGECVNPDIIALCICWKAAGPRRGRSCESSRGVVFVQISCGSDVEIPLGRHRDHPTKSYG